MLRVARGQEIEHRLRHIEGVEPRVERDFAVAIADGYKKAPQLGLVNLKVLNQIQLVEHVHHEQARIFVIVRIQVGKDVQVEREHQLNVSFSHGAQIVSWENDIVIVQHTRRCQR